MTAEDSPELVAGPELIARGLDGAADKLVLEQRGAALWARLNRPAVLNAIDVDLIDALAGALTSAEGSPDIRALVITGAGRAFCVGADLRLVEQGGSALTFFLRLVGDLFSRIEHAPIPVIAAVRGLALAGGLELALCCDLVYAGESARFGDAHANYGLLPGGGGSIRLPRRVGPVRAKELLFTGELVSGEALVSSGLVNKVVPDEMLDAEIDRIVELIATKSPLGLRRMKQLVNDGLEQPTSTGLRLERLAGEAHALSHDMREGLAAFAEKRTPCFSGE